MRVFLRGSGLLALVLALMLASCAGGGGAGESGSANPSVPSDFTPQSPRIDPAALMADLRTLCDPGMEGRKVGTPGNVRARAFLSARFASLGLEPLGSHHEQPWYWGGTEGVNLVGRLKGTTFPDRVILVSAHFDHIGIIGGKVHPGADDNASGSAALLRLATHLAAHPPAHTVLFCLFDGEESGLLGSQAFVANPPLDLAKIAVVVNLDMVAQGTQGRIFVGGTSYTASLKPALTAAFAGSRVALVPDFERWDHASDQHPFMQRGIPFLFFCVGDDDPWYHTPEDKFERIPASFYWGTTEAILETLLRLDAQANLPALVPHGPAGPEVPPVRRLEPHPWRGGRTTLRP
ncbi:MAG: M28 family peptidase [Acidobacteria bacterium]|nr:M28 family peptidase [Acidobacteriota bacterium]